MFQDLERRRLFSELFVFGTSFADGVELSRAGTVGAGIDVRVRNTGHHPLTVKVDAVAIRLAAGATIRSEEILPGGVTRIRRVDLGASADRLDTLTDITLPMTIYGGTGNDHLIGGNGRDFTDGGAGNDTLYGQNGNDTLLGRDGNDSLLGQSGNDSMAGGLGNDSYVFGSAIQPQVDTVDEAADAGSDMLDFGTTATAVTVNLANPDLLASFGSGPGSRIIRMAAGEPATRLEQITGSGGNDHLAGNARDNTIFGGGGNDVIFGGAGKDSIDGGSGNDTLFGGADDDYLSGAIGQDSVNGDAGNDLVVDYSGINALSGGAGNDVFINQNGEPDTVRGGDGFDSVQDDDTRSSVPGLQNDLFSDVEYVYDAIRSPADSLSALLDDAPASAFAADTADAPVTAAAVTGGVSITLDGLGVLRVFGSGSADVLTLTQDSRAIRVSVGGVVARSFAVTSVRKIIVAAGAGNDTVRLASASGRNALQLNGVRVSGGPGNDVLIGGEGNDVLAGELGDDYVNGGPGNDIVNGDFVVLRGEAVPLAARTIDGNDTVVGGAGSTDIVTYTYRTAAVRIDLRPGGVSGSRGERDLISGVEYVVAGQGADGVDGSTADDTIFGGPGDDRLAGGPGSDRLLGGFGRDLLDPTGGSDRLDTGGDDGVQDTVNGSLDNQGITAFSPDGVLLEGTFEHRDINDFFALSGRRYGTAGR